MYKRNVKAICDNFTLVLNVYFYMYKYLSLHVYKCAYVKQCRIIS